MIKDTPIVISPHKLSIQKSRPLLSLCRSEMSLIEFKILDVYLARINSHDPRHRTVTLSKGELEHILGVKKINNTDLSRWLMNLMKNVVKIPDADEKEGFRMITLFEEARAKRDKNGLWQINLECTQKAMKYIFNIENIGYLRYKLYYITKISSRYAYIMFIYLKSNQYRRKWSVELQELKQILMCDTTEIYNEYKYFNRNILQKVQKELIDKECLQYTYTPVKRGRMVHAIQFDVEKDNDAAYMLSVDEIRQTEIRPHLLWENALADSGFMPLTPEQIAQVQAILCCIPERNLPCDPASGCGDIEIQRYHFMLETLTDIQRRASEKPIKNRFLYLIKVLKQRQSA